MTIDHEDRSIGCLLGAACGDILGAAVEGWSAREIERRYGRLRGFLDTDRGFGCYTDDTQMALALATSIVEQGRVDAAHVSARYAEFYEPWRGYGGAAHRVMRALRHGADHRGTGRLQFPEGSFANGGAMRIARVGNGIRASEAVAAALWAFLRYGSTPEECAIRAVGFGGDTDTIGTMAGALAGALHGAAWIPTRWYECIENAEHGRDEIVALGRKLARVSIDR